MQDSDVAIKDFTTDEALTFLPLLKEAAAIPDWLETAVEKEDVQHLPSVAFADSFRRHMPIHTKAATFLSAVGALVYDYPSETGWENRLKAACASYGIVEEVKKAHAVLGVVGDPYHEKAAEETPKIAYALELVPAPDQEPLRFYPINSAEQVESSALKMAADMHQEKLPQSWFAEAADRFVKAASEFGLPITALPRTVRELAEDRLPSPEYLGEQIERRKKQAALAEDAVTIYREAVQAVLDKEASALEAAHVWELADRKLGIRYTDTLACPVASFRSGMTRENFEKMAGSVVPVAGVTVPFNQLQLLQDAAVAAMLPQKIAAVVFQAKGAPSGLKAAATLGALDEAEQLLVLELLTESAHA